MWQLALAKAISKCLGCGMPATLSASFGCRSTLLDHNSTVPKHHYEIMFHQPSGDGTILFTPNNNGFGVSNSKGLGASSHVCLLPPRKPMMRDKYQTWEADDGRPSAQITQTKRIQLPRSQTRLTNLGIRRWPWPPNLPGTKQYKQE